MMLNPSFILRCLLLGLPFGSGIVANAQEPLLAAVRFVSGGGNGDEENRITSNVPLNEINIHAFRHFRKRFPEVSGESWWKTETGYTVSFTENARRNQAHYNLKGSFLYSVKYYTGKELPAGMEGWIMKRYPGYHIGVVTEFTDGSRSFWLVKIEDPSSVKTLEINDGKIELVEDLINGG